ncbi:hypothetical protein H6F76_27505 [Leptolyngbya sp. FACHB-321]|uniref:hypothetical protein n=1 Tax=Leptolyngbya sp. FACHB-321 TaxID=2692807 RepID=UPI001683C5CB|nr:hypothetical protein [Leptolyngbya sp. FACHB-321]MBD2038706.1 hypothetical protein [Leptolyngbya sp. FACHB-321]
MAKLLKRLLIITSRLFIALVLSGVVFLGLILFVAPALLDSGNVLPTHSGTCTGFYLMYPSLTGKVNNLNCRTNGLGLDGYSYFCRFNVESSNIERFIRESQLVRQPGLESWKCNRLYEGWIPKDSWWKPLELKGESQCYEKHEGSYSAVLYSSKSQLAYINEADY